MKKYIALMASVIALALPFASHANEGFYVGGMAGVNFLDINERHFDTDTGYTVGLVGGYKFCNNFRAEAEVSYRHNKFDVRLRERFLVENDSFEVRGRGQGNINTWSFMANGYYDLPVCWIVTPYVGAGIGYDHQRSRGHFRAHVDQEGFESVRSSFRDSHGRFAWQVMAGVNYDLCTVCEDLELNLEYKYHNGQKHLNNHAVTLGIKKFF